MHIGLNSKQDSILLGEKLKVELKERANDLGLSLAAMVRMACKHYLKTVKSL